MHAAEWIDVVSAVTAAAAGDSRQIRLGPSSLGQTVVFLYVLYL